MKRIMVVFGTRPEAIKLAPVIQALKNEKTFKVVVCSTGQHREMLQQVLNIFKLKVDIDLDLMMPNQSLFELSANSIRKFDATLNKYNPDLLIVQGDTTTAFTAALAAFYKKIKIAHVEVGLRSYDAFHPYPEEANRRFISIISDFNFVPTNDSKQNLLREGFSTKTINVTGNTVIDALLQIKEILIATKLNNTIKKNLLKKFGNEFFKKEFILVTLHRREKFGNEMRNLLLTLKKLAGKYSEYNFVYPVHMNPNVLNPVKEILSNTKNFILTEPMDYLTFMFMMSKCRMIMSDSGGIQEECFVFKKPIIVLRTVTERNEAVRAGYAFLAGSDKKVIENLFIKINQKISKGYNFFPIRNPYGDGKASEKIVKVLKNKL